MPIKSIDEIIAEFSKKFAVMLERYTAAYDAEQAESMIWEVEHWITSTLQQRDRELLLQVIQRVEDSYECCYGHDPILKDGKCADCNEALNANVIIESIVKALRSLLPPTNQGGKEKGV